MIMKKAVVAITQEEEVLVAPVVTPTLKEVNQDLLHRNKEPKGRTVPQEALEEDSVVQTEDLETMVLVAEDLEIVPLEVVRDKLNEAAESIDILKDRQFQ